ncbi:MAG: tRNA 2-thiouridine(34) synthase MnmA [Deltaproteobacteria bacterium]|nr:tRNA 2-thiouridine(34) synthase MnmA [Deltaproteobacteria bacterium]
MKVLVAMSGGVDSSVAAYLLKEEGHEVIGVSMNLLTCHRTGEVSCCSAEDRRDARKICDQLGISHYVLDYRARFREKVIDPFVEEYLVGRTPSPCILCNEHIKFAELFAEAEKMGADYVATGHYARIEKDGDRYRFFKGADPKKDQTYFLFMLGQDELARLLFPVGKMTKEESRRVAVREKLATMEKPESQDVCFVPDGDCASFIEERAGNRVKGSGDFVSMAGEVIGRHRGIYAYTIGQRRGIGFGVGERQYVVRIDPIKNEVVLGSKDDLRRMDLIVRDPSWVYENMSTRKDVVVKIRSAHAGVPADLNALNDGSVEVLFKKPVEGVAPGQAAVFYDGEEVLGGGWIA